ncbi:MAG: hypothetical protein ACYC3A_10215 [Halothiobacillus sp.]
MQDDQLMGKMAHFNRERIHVRHIHGDPRVIRWVLGRLIGPSRWIQTLNGEIHVN